MVLYYLDVKGTGLQTHTKIFDSRTYKFRDINTPKDIYYNPNLILLNNNNVLVVPGTTAYNKYNPSYIYYPDKYKYEKVEQIEESRSAYFSFRMENGDTIVFRGQNEYLFKDGKYQKYMQIPSGDIQLDSKYYFRIEPEFDCTSGYIYNVKDNIKIPIKNKINKTWVANPNYPKMVLLDNKNVLILGIYAEKQKIGARKKYTTYIYSFEKNEFFKIPNPPLYISKNTASVRLKNGDILFVGGQLNNKMEIYRYKH